MSISQKTIQHLKENILFAPLKKWIVLAGLCLLMAGASSANKQKSEAIIYFRSEQWREVFVNGRSIGFTPVNHIFETGGSYRLTWVSAHGKHERTLTVFQGPPKVLSDDFFMKK